MNSIKDYLVFWQDNGEINITASVQKFTDSLNSYQRNIMDMNDRVHDAIMNVFDTYKGNILSRSSIAMFALQELNCSPENIKELTASINSYLTNNSGSRDAKYFGTKKGNGGGVFRHTDFVESDAIYSAK